MISSLDNLAGSDRPQRPKFFMHYILKDKIPVPEPNIVTWGVWMTCLENRTVADEMVGNVRVATHFLGMPRAFSCVEPLLFETMIFGGPHHGARAHSSTWEQAERQHALAVKMVKGGE